MGAGLEREGIKSYMCWLYEPKGRGGGGQGSCTRTVGKVAGLLSYFPRCPERVDLPFFPSSVDCLSKAGFILKVSIDLYISTVLLYKSYVHLSH